MTGRIRLLVDKDRHGGVRGQSAGGKHAGTATLTSSRDGSNVTLTITAPDDRPYEERVQEPNTGLMTRISAHLARTTGGLSGAQLEKEIGGNRDRVRVALKALLEAKCVEQRPREGRGGGFVFAHVAHYRPDVDDLVDRGDDDA
jgi:hypothetical protein